MQRFFYRIADAISFHNLTVFIVSLTAVVSLLAMFTNYSPGVVNHETLIAGRWWNLLFYPFRLYDEPRDIIWLGFTLYIFWLFGNDLEMEMGRIRFNLFVFLGLFLVSLGAGFFPNQMMPRYFYFSVFFAMAIYHPNTEILLLFFPLKLKWAAALLGIFILYPTVRLILHTGNLLFLIGPALGLGNLIFFFLPQGVKALRQKKARNVHRSKFQVASAQRLHKCYVCGRTEESDAHLEFRYCEECGGEVEYCLEHLRNHTHLHTEN